MLTLLVSLGVVWWLYSSVMNLGQGLKRRDLHKLVYSLPYKDKLGFQPAPSQDQDGEQVGRASRLSEKERSSRRSRKHSSHYSEAKRRGSGTRPGSSSSSISDSPPWPHSTATAGYSGGGSYPHGAMPRPYGVPVPPPGWAGPGGRMQMPSRTSEPQVVSVSRPSKTKRKPTAGKKKESNMGSLMSFSRRPISSSQAHDETSASRSYAADEVPESYRPPHAAPPDNHGEGPSSSRAGVRFARPPGSGGEARVNIVQPGQARGTKTSRSPPRASSDTSKDS